MFKSLRSKILAGFLLVIGFMGGIGAWAINQLSDIQSTTGATLQRRFEVVNALNTFDTLASHMRTNATRMLLMPGDSIVAAKFRVYETSTTHELERISSGVGPLSSDPRLYRSFYQIAHLMTLIRNEIDFEFGSEFGLSGGVPKGAKPMGIETRSQIFLSEIDPLFDSLKTRIDFVQGNYLSSIGSLSTVSIEEGARIRTEVLVLGSIVFVFCIFLSIRFASVIVQPVVELTEKTERITAGELNQLVIPRTNDEVGRLGEQFNAMAQKLAEFEELNLKKILEEKAISESIVQSMDDALILIDRFGRILSINRRAQEIFHLTAVENRNCLDVAHGIPALEWLCTAALKGTWRESNRHEVIEFIPPSSERDHRRPVHMYVNRDVIPIQSGDAPGVVGYLLLIRDVTQSYELERMRSDFVGMVSHELRTPLTAIRMSVDLLAEPTLGPMTEVQAQFVQAIREESERLLRIVNDLMDLAKIESGTFEVRPSGIDLSPFFEHLLVPFTASSQEAGITIDVRPDPKLTSVFADPDRLKQVFVNLISNALRYTPQGGTITIGAGLAPEPGFARFFVRDTGSGIPPEFLPRIFDRFTIRSKDAKAGTGLGLAIAKEIVQAHGGSISVASELHNGTEFSFTIPMKSPPEASKAQPSNDEAISGAKPPLSDVNQTS
ncbi:MAG: ATP-binding protein [Bacteroidota bacterium]|nr:ATP-binding protein [Bacteroidota bacterium]MDP4233279.1 ATP-binding protein [Bacteroidota bacterium]MDP4242101.1 ATP-binding protein [Bacteroidota bacterium]MDP4288620.1 ATP-binding protein [Bacteroidota bacterium]